MKMLIHNKANQHIDALGAHAIRNKEKKNCIRFDSIN